jgi:nucleotide-binding universal stress UspA family protein
VADSGAEFAVAESRMAESASVQDQGLPQGFGRKIVKTADLGLRAENVRVAAAEAQRVAARFGGSVLSSEAYRADGSVSADMVLSVPSPEFEAALDELRRLGEEVTTDSVRGEDVTEEFVDLQSRERNLLAAEEGLLKLYDRAEDVEDALSIQRELTGIRGQVEEVQGRIQYLEQITASSQISVGILPVAEAPGSPAWNPALVAAKAWNASLRVLQGLANAVITALVFGWWLVPVLLGVLAGWRWWARPPSPDPGP